MGKEKIGVYIAVKKDILGILQKCLLGFSLNIIIYHLHLLSVMWNDLSVTSGKEILSYYANALKNVSKKMDNCKRCQSMS